MCQKFESKGADGKPVTTGFCTQATAFYIAENAKAAGVPEAAVSVDKNFPYPDTTGAYTVANGVTEKGEGPYSKGKPGVNYLLLDCKKIPTGVSIFSDTKLLIFYI